MYEGYYHFKAKPFQLSPDPRFFFSSRGHNRAMAYLVYGAFQGEGFIVITGEIGTGKTMLANALAGKLASRNVVLGQVVSTHLKADDVVRMVAASFGLTPQKNKAALLSNIEQFLVSCHRKGQRVILIIDEAQNLPEGSVEELRMLSNFLCGTQSVLQIFLLGQPEFRRVLQRPGMEQLRQRVIASCHLGPMDRADTEAYVLHRLQTAGWRGDPSFSPDAFNAIFQHTGGIPRKINILCNRLMLMGRLDEKHAFTGQDVVAVFDDLQKDFLPPEWRTDREVGTS